TFTTKTQAGRKTVLDLGWKTSFTPFIHSLGSEEVVPFTWTTNSRVGNGSPSLTATMKSTPSSFLLSPRTSTSFLEVRSRPASASLLSTTNQGTFSLGMRRSYSRNREPTSTMLRLDQ